MGYSGEPCGEFLWILIFGWQHNFCLGRDRFERNNASGGRIRRRAKHSTIIVEAALSALAPRTFLFLRRGYFSRSKGDNETRFELKEFRLFHRHT
jgi:hypothetical protein